MKHITRNSAILRDRVLGSEIVRSFAGIGIFPKMFMAICTKRIMNGGIGILRIAAVGFMHFEHLVQLRQHFVGNLKSRGIAAARIVEHDCRRPNSHMIGLRCRRDTKSRIGCQEKNG